MSGLLLGLLEIGLSAFGKLIDRFFSSKRGKRIKSYLPDAAAVVAIIAARTETAVDDKVAEIAKELGTSGSVEELLRGPMGDFIKTWVARKLLQEKTDASDSEANTAVELVISQSKSMEEEKS